MSSILFSSLKIREITFKNRIFMAPMCQYSAVNGVPSTWHMVHYGARAAGGAGLLIVEATGVTPEGRISPGDLGLWNDEQVEAFKPITSFAREQGAVIGVQLAHAGRKASSNYPWRGGNPLTAPEGAWQTLAPSPLPFAPGHPEPKELSKGEIEQVIESFRTAAVRAHKAGFQVVELHMAHGYLMHEFLSPLTNKRTDEYGGRLENRLKVPLKVARAVREVWPKELPLFVRLSATDWVEGGWDLDQTIALVRELKEVGVDFIDTSTGGLTPDAKIPAAPGFQVPFAAGVREDAKILTGAVGLITEPAHAEEILATGQADAILLGRELLRNPHWPLEAAKALGAETSWPAQYLRAKR